MNHLHKLRRHTTLKAHNWLSSRMSWYHNWHHHPHHKKVHFGALIVSISLIISSIISTILPYGAQHASASISTWNFSGDNSVYDYDSNKISTANNQATLSNPGSATGATTNINPATGASTDGAAHFSSANKEYLTITSNESLQTGNIDFEVGAWMRLDSKSTTQAIIQKYSISDNKEYALYYRGSTDRFEFTVSSDGTATQAISADNFGAVSISVWYYVRAYHDSANNKIGIQVNNGTVNTIDYSSGVKANGTSSIDLGTFAGGNYLNGRIDSAYFKKGISTSDEATKLYNNGAGATYSQLTSLQLTAYKASLTSWWDLNEEEGIRYDAHSTNHLNPAAAQLIAPPTYGSELVQNGGFETAGSPNWANWLQDIPAVSAVSNETVSIHSGSNAAKLTRTTATSDIHQSLNVTSGANYYLSYWVKGDGANQARHKVYDITNSADIVAVGFNGVSAATYTLVSVPFTTPAGCNSVRIILYGAIVNDSYVYYDDVSVKQITNPGALNGGFENLDGANNFSNWAEAVSGSSTVNDETDPANVYSGSHALRLDIDASNNSGYLAQATLTVGNRYKVTFYAKANTGTPSIKAGDSNNPTYSTNLTTSYAQYTGYFTATSPTFWLGRNSAANASLYVDNITLESVGPTFEAGIAAGHATDGNFAAQFNGTNTISVPNVSQNGLNPRTGDFAVSTWVNVDSISSIQGIVGKGAISNDAGWNISVSTSGYIYVKFSDGTSTAIYSSTTTGTLLTVGQYYHVVCNFDRDGNAQLYVNAVSDNSVNISGRSNDVNDSSDYTIGGRSASTNKLNGRVDQTMFINRLLAPDEIVDLFNNGKGLKYSQLPDSIKNDANLVSYWDLDEKSGTRNDSHGTNHLTDNGSVTQAKGVNYFEGAVSKVQDLSSNGNHFTQTTPAKRPVYDSLGINSKPALLLMAWMTRL